jgi:hypothetical protein
VEEAGMIRTQMGTHNRSEMVAVQGSPCAPAPNSNIKKMHNASKYSEISVCLFVLIIPDLLKDASNSSDYTSIFGARQGLK